MTVTDSIRKGAGMVHGTGEAIRGTAMSMVDDASGNHAAAVKNQEIANKGTEEWDKGYRGHVAGVSPVDNEAERERQNTVGSQASNYGPHSTNLGNKADPRFDSDTDHRGTKNDATNYGPHSTNAGNKVDPRFDSDTDHRGTTTDSTNFGPHRTNVGNKADPHVDSDVDHRADPTSAVGAHLASLHTAQTDGTAEGDYAWPPPEDHQDTWHPAHEYQHGPHPPHEHRGSIGGSSGLEAANKLDPIFAVGPDEESMKYVDHPDVHRLRGSISGASGLQPAERLDPPIEMNSDRLDEVSARGPRYSQPDPSYHQPTPLHSSSVANVLGSDVGSESIPTLNRTATEPLRQYDDRYEPPAQSHSKRYSPDSDGELTRQARRRSQAKVDPAVPIVGPKTMKGEARSTSNPHKSEILNMLDPRVDQKAVRKSRQSDSV